MNHLATQRDLATVPSDALPDRNIETPLSLSRLRLSIEGEKIVVELPEITDRIEFDPADFRELAWVGKRLARRIELRGGVQE
jgi:hypothetical protein